MKASHTIGPWRILTEGTDEDCIVRTIMAGHPKAPRNLSEVACITTGSYTDEVEDANARLIAAAPELLEAVEDALHHHIEFGGLHNDTVLKLKAAIEKAKAQ